MSWLITGSEKIPPLGILSLAAWWDASDDDSFTYSSGTVVQDWRSRIGNYTLTQATSANRPTRSGTVNGLPTVVFDGTNDSLSVANFDLSGGQKFSLWAVFSCVSGGDQIIVEHSINHNFNIGAFLCYRASSNAVVLGKRGEGASVFLYSVFQTTSTVTTSPKSLIGIHDGSLSTNESTARVNAAWSGSYIANDNTNANNIISTLFVGARNGSSVFLNGQICELGITTAALTNDEIGLLESYLSRKWALGF
jgi:hypothetical protein